jgi:hypothetical protein
VEQCENKNCYNELEEGLIVGTANTIIQPSAVMIKSTDASIATTAVLCIIGDIRFADLTEV